VSQTFTRHQLEKWSGWPVALLDELIGHGKSTGVLHWPLAKLQWLRARGVPWSSGTMSAAVKYGNVKLMSWVLANGGEMSANSMAMGAYHGQLEAMKWLHAHGCEVRRSSILKAAANAQQGVMVWLIEEVKFPFDGETRLQAKQAVLKAALNASTGVQHNLALYRRAKTLDASARAKGYWL